MGGRSLYIVSLLAVALAGSLILAMLGAQAGFAGLGETLATLGDPSIRHAVLLSLSTSSVAALLALLLGVPAAYGLARYDFPGKAAVDLLLDVPVVLSPVAVGVSFLLLFRTSFGIWVEENLLRFVFEPPGIVLAQLPAALGLTVRVVKASFQGVDRRYEDVARFLGCSQFKAFSRVTLPMAKRGIIAAFILAFARSVGEFGATVTLAGAVAGKTETVPVAIYLKLSGADVGGAVALMLLLTFTSLGVLLIVRFLGGAR